MKQIFLEAIFGMMKDKKPVWKNQHSSTNMIAFYDEMIGSEVIKAAHNEFNKAFAMVSIASL